MRQEGQAGNAAERYQSEVDMRRFACIPYPSELLMLTLLVLFTTAVKAADLTQPVILVATERLADSPLAETVLVAAPLSDGSHIAFVVSNPTNHTLASLFPEHVAARRVADSVFLGGPLFPQTLFAIAHVPLEHKQGLLELAPGVVVVFQADEIDRIIETAPNDARYFLGLILWPPGGLEEEVDKGVWQARPAEARTVFSQKPRNLWRTLYDGTHSAVAREDTAPAQLAATFADTAKSL